MSLNTKHQSRSSYWKIQGRDQLVSSGPIDANGITRVDSYQNLKRGVQSELMGFRAAYLKKYGQEVDFSDLF